MTPAVAIASNSWPPTITLMAPASDATVNVRMPAGERVGPSPLRRSRSAPINRPIPSATVRYFPFSAVTGVALCTPRFSVRAEPPPRCWLRIEANDDGSWGIFRVLDRRARLLYSKWGTQVGCRHHGMFDADQRPPLPGAQHETTHWHPGSHRSNAMKRLSLVLASAILLIASIQIDPSVAKQTSTSNRTAPFANLVLIPGAMAGDDRSAGLRYVLCIAR